MHSSSSWHWSPLWFSISMVTGLMSFSLTRPHPPQGSILVFTHHCTHILGRGSMLNKHLLNISKGCVREEKSGQVSVGEMNSYSNKLEILWALLHIFEKASWSHFMVAVTEQALNEVTIWQNNLWQAKRRSRNVTKKFGVLVTILGKGSQSKSDMKLPVYREPRG